jgi:hypothetical protein
MSKSVCAERLVALLFFFFFNSREPSLDTLYPEAQDSQREESFAGQY